MLDVEELLYQAVHEDTGQTAHAVVRQMQSLSGWVVSLPLRLVLSWPSIYGRGQHSTTVNYHNNYFLGIENGLGQLCIRTTWRIFFGCFFVECYEGTPMEDMDEDETRGTEVEALGGK